MRASGGALIAAFVFEVSKVGRPGFARRVKGEYADEGAGKRPMFAAARFVREDRRVENRTDVAPAVGRSAGELQAGSIDPRRRLQRGPRRPKGSATEARSSVRRSAFDHDLVVVGCSAAKRHVGPSRWPTYSIRAID